jgi:hypothetical protein
MPHVRHLFEDYEDNWWIKPMPQRVQPGASIMEGVPAGGAD